MFLSELSTEEKKAFLEVAHKLISADSVQTDEETGMLLQYQKEMNVNENEYTIGTLSYENSIEQLKNMDKVMKKKIFFELLALAMCDHEYSSREKEFVANLQKIFEVSDEQVSEFLKCIDGINTIYEKLGELIYE